MTDKPMTSFILMDNLPNSVLSSSSCSVALPSELPCSLKFLRSLLSMSISCMLQLLEAPLSQELAGVSHPCSERDVVAIGVLTVAPTAPLRT